MRGRRARPSAGGYQRPGPDPVSVAGGVAATTLANAARKRYRGDETEEPMVALRNTILAACLVLPAPALADDRRNAVTPELTEKLRELLQKEMQLVSDAMGTIHEAIVTGDHASVAEQATAIHESFVLKQNLTQAHRKDLLEAVPRDFVERDKKFHADAARLAEAARRQDTAAELELFQRLTRQCTGCHARHVSNQFPDLTAGH
jgi:cytochrome c556